MKILLIKPRWFVKGGIYRSLENIKFTPLHIAIIAALSNGHEVKLIDNDWDEIPYDEDFDIVGITTTTFTSQRAYKIARHFRQKGSKVVLGGVHPTLMPDECLEHCDAVVKGEAEYVWPNLLKDARNGALKKIYYNPEPVEMKDVPFPRRDLLNEDCWVATVQATRGCPNKCGFCYLSNMPWAVYRKRDISSVIEEVKSVPQKIIFFVDDNLFADEDYVIELCDKLTPLNKIWSVQAPMNIVNNDRLLQKMQKAGCFHVQIGFQTVNPRSLEWASVRQNKVEKYRYVVRKLHQYGILAIGFFIFGFDYDDKHIFSQTYEIIKEMDLDEAHLYILTPYPGTALYDKLKKENRLIDETNRLSYGWDKAVFTPKLMSALELEQGVQKVYDKFGALFKRKAPMKFLRKMGLFVKHPEIFKQVINTALRRVDISRAEYIEAD